MSNAPSGAVARPILLFGGTGQVGRELLASLPRVGQVLAPPRSEADLADPRSLRHAIRRANPSAIVNAAALTNVDRAEGEPALARALNEEAPAVMAEEAARRNTLLVHYSTDYVFDGQTTKPYSEDAPPNPINIYGVSKLAGERAVANANGSHLIIRTSWVYSPNGTGFVAGFLRDLRERESIRVVADQVGSPTWSASLAKATTAILEALRVDDGFHLASPDAGIYHLGGSGAATRVEIAHHILGLSQGWGHRPTLVIPISAEEFAAPARRPSYSALTNARVERRFGITLPPWRDELARMLGVIQVHRSVSC